MQVWMKDEKMERIKDWKDEWINEWSTEGPIAYIYERMIDGQLDNRIFVTEGYLLKHPRN